MPGGAFVCSGSMKRAMGPKKVKDAVAGRKTVRKLFSKEQRALYAAHAPDGLALEDLAILGPIMVVKLKFAPKDFKRKLVAELWLYPDNTMLLELSTKCTPEEAFEVGHRAAGVPDEPRRRPLGRAGDEDEEGARVLLEAVAGDGCIAP